MTTVFITLEKQGCYTINDVAFQKVQQPDRYFLKRYTGNGWATMSVMSAEGIKTFLSANSLTKVYSFSADEKEGVYRPAPQGAQHQSQPSQ